MAYSSRYVIISQVRECAFRTGKVEQDLKIEKNLPKPQTLQLDF